MYVEGFRIASLDQLEQIKAGCQSTIENYALASPLFSSNTDLDFVADIVGLMFSTLRSRYSLDTVNAADFSHYETLTALGNEVFNYVTKEGVVKFITKYGAKFWKILEVRRKYSHVFPILLGPIESGGYDFTVDMGMRYSKNCYDLCREILRS